MGYKHPFLGHLLAHNYQLGALTEVGERFWKLLASVVFFFQQCTRWLLLWLFVILPGIMQVCTSSSQSFGMTPCCVISSVSYQVSDIYAQVSFINFRPLSSGTPLHTSTLQTLHFTDVLAMAAQGFCSLGNIIDLQYMWVFPDVVAVWVSRGCTNGNCVVLTDNKRDKCQ